MGTNSTHTSRRDAFTHARSLCVLYMHGRQIVREYIESVCVDLFNDSVQGDSARSPRGSSSDSDKHKEKEIQISAPLPGIAKYLYRVVLYLYYSITT